MVCERLRGQKRRRKSRLRKRQRLRLLGGRQQEREQTGSHGDGRLGFQLQFFQFFFRLIGRLFFRFWRKQKIIFRSHPADASGEAIRKRLQPVEIEK